MNVQISQPEILIQSFLSQSVQLNSIVVFVDFIINKACAKMPVFNER